MNETTEIENKIVCLDCKKPFTFGVNIFSEDGRKEAKISGMCESCFDDLFDE